MENFFKKENKRNNVEISASSSRDIQQDNQGGIDIYIGKIGGSSLENTITIETKELARFLREIPKVLPVLGNRFFATYCRSKFDGKFKLLACTYIGKEIINIFIKEDKEDNDNEIKFKITIEDLEKIILRH